MKSLLFLLLHDPIDWKQSLSKMMTIINDKNYLIQSILMMMMKLSNNKNKVTSVKYKKKKELWKRRNLFEFIEFNG